MDRILNFIDGQYVAPKTGLYLDSYRPRDGMITGQIPDSTALDINLAVAAAKKAFPTWKRLQRAERASYLYRIAELIEAKADMFAEAESQDQGKPLHLAKQMDIPRAIENFRFFAGAILHQQEKAFQTNEHILNYTRREAMGVAGLISPWNLPLYLLTWKIAPALATGNTVVAKPSELTSLSAFLLTEVFQEAKLPAGVCNIVFGRGPTAGDALVTHPDVPLISFTGGTATGALISQRAAPHAKKLSLELGGKNPAIIFQDAAFDNALTTTLRSSFLNQGEICLCTSRILIHEKIFTAFSEQFAAAAARLKVGDPRLKDSFMGPLVSREHLEKVDGYVQRAKQQGLPLLTGGERLKLDADLATGYFYPPTVFIANDAESELMQNEVFGPVVTLTPFKDLAEAISIANSTRYGLAASIWTQNIDTAHRCAAELEAAQIWINTWLQRDLRVPFGGMKDSGIGREGGDYSLEFYTEEKNICLQLAT